MALKRAGAPTDGPGPWFRAGYDGECDSCGADYDAGDEIRADGSGGWECCDEPPAPSRDPFVGTSDAEMGF